LPYAHACDQGGDAKVSADFGFGRNLSSKLVGTTQVSGAPKGQCTGDEGLTGVSKATEHVGFVADDVVEIVAKPRGVDAGGAFGFAPQGVTAEGHQEVNSTIRWTMLENITH
jgi:hypothetical protein